MLTVTETIQIPLRDLTFTFVRSSGPGGQNVNKVNTKAVLRWQVSRTPHLPEDVRERFLKRYSRRIAKTGELVLASQRFRDQGRNVGDCLARLREMILDVAPAPVARKKKKVTRAAKARRKQQKQEQSQKKHLRRKVRWRGE